jgi:NADH-quinone oxidoreductase chain I
MIVPLLKGLAVTLKYFFSKPFARQYPEERVEMTDRWRGIHYFERREDGSTKCVACGLCEAVCPSNCIYVEAEEYENGNRFPRVYEIDGTRCIFCGFCEEICPVNAIKMGRNYEYVKHERSDCVFDTVFLIDQEKLNS